MSSSETCTLSYKLKITMHVVNMQICFFLHIQPVLFSKKVGKHNGIVYFVVEECNTNMTFMRVYSFKEIILF